MPKTNNANLPASIIRALENDPYDAGKADISTTRLINPPQLETLRYRHKDEITEDYSERLWSLLGQAAHVVLERSRPEGSIAEKRYFADIEGWTVSGAVDLIDQGVLIDYKVTSVWTHIYGSRLDEWTAQGNVNRWLAYKNGNGTINSLKNILILRDWSKSDANRIGNYPLVQVVEQPLKLWPIEAAEAYVRERVKLHQAARAATDEELMECTPEEYWQNAKTGRRTRCEQYCSAAAFCNQFKKYKESLESK